MKIFTLLLLSFMGASAYATESCDILNYKSGKSTTTKNVGLAPRAGYNGDLGNGYTLDVADDPVLLIVTLTNNKSGAKISASGSPATDAPVSLTLVNKDDNGFGVRCN